VFTEPPGGWSDDRRAATLTALNADNVGTLGFSVGIDGNTVVASAPGTNGSQGAVYVFTRRGSAWRNETDPVSLTAASGDPVTISATRWPSAGTPW
jgi:hypothetical protein